MLSHQKLKVYGKGLAVVASLAKHSAAWDQRHAVVDQLCRASESIVLNLAEAARLDSPTQKQQLLDYAVGSALECAACLDSRLYRQVDKAGTSVILNIAEGYGRTGEEDRLSQSRFKQFAVKFAVKFNRVKCPISSAGQVAGLSGRQDARRSAK